MSSYGPGENFGVHTHFVKYGRTFGVSERSARQKVTERGFRFGARGILSLRGACLCVLQCIAWRRLGCFLNAFQHNTISLQNGNLIPHIKLVSLSLFLLAIRLKWILKGKWVCFNFPMGLGGDSHITRKIAEKSQAKNTSFLRHNKQTIETRHT